ncbi:uncharacterized protein LOC123883182 [Trifolium pratense]|uniref:uncharacterized protein LOC123883182 n=1 Tax=Trifolium pratense TaxID=57577 RepID=UPI001E6901D9|nr:uncharacterized protein LOC123883182 [Trifolium pratense]
MIKFTSVEDIMNFLLQFKANLIVTSDNADLQYKKLRDEIIEYVLQELNHNVQPDLIVTSDNADLKYKKLRDEIIEYVLEELNHNVQPDLIVTSDNADLQYKKLRDEIIEYVLQELNHNVQPEYVSQKKAFLFLCVIFWFIVVLAVLFFTPDVDRGLVPT